MKKNIKAVIFDHDNTIAHTEPLWVQAACMVLQNRGISVSHEMHESLTDALLGLGLTPVAQLLIDQFALPDTPELLCTQMCQFIQQLYRSDLSFIPGFTDFFKRVQLAHLRVAIASNSDPDSIALAAHTLGLNDLFGSHIYHAGHVSQPKPDPELYLLAARKLHVTPSECIAIEDSSHGIAAAQQAGIYCIGITTSGKREMVADADLIVDTYDEIDLSSFIT